MKSTKLILIIVFMVFECQAQAIKKGDNIYKAFKKLKVTTEKDAPAMGYWHEESSLKVITEKADGKASDFYFISYGDKKLVAIFNQGVNFVIDLDGDSVLDVESDAFWLPLWVCKDRFKISSTDSSVLRLLDDIYESTLQADSSGLLDKKTVEAYSEYWTDTTLVNRHIMYLFDSYKTLVTEANNHKKPAPTELCMPIMKSLSGECISLYGKIPVVICIYMGEALIDAGLEDKAREHIKLSLRFYPNSIPLQVYDCKLEPDSKKRAHKMNLLKIYHPDHWMVKTL